MKIAKITAREIFDSRGIPTIECQLSLEDGSYVTASVPSGRSKGKFEAFELRDGGSRLEGKGVLRAIENIERIIAPPLLGRDPDVIEIDEFMIQLDGTANKQRLGANAILAVSLAVAKAQAAALRMEPYELIAKLLEQETVMMPLPAFNMINGGAHADDGLRIQEFMIIPLAAKSFRDAMEHGAIFFYQLKKLLHKKGYETCVGDEGGFAPKINDDRIALDILKEVINQLQNDYVFKISLDIAATQFYNEEKEMYQWKEKIYEVEMLINFYKELIAAYPICSIEDGVAESDIKGWSIMMEEFGSLIQIVGDDIFVSNKERIYQGVLGNLATAVVIKPNQVGTITEALQAIGISKENGLGIIVSHRSGETNDAFIADLVVGTSGGQIKAGGLCRGERLAKYNRLLAIEDQLTLALLER